MIYRIVKLDRPYYIKASSFEEAIKKADILSFEKKQSTDDERMVDDVLHIMEETGCCCKEDLNL